MRITVGECDIEVAAGVPARAIAALARERGEHIDNSPWCGPVRLNPDHPAGTSPLVHAARLSAEPGPDASPHRGAHLAVVAGPDSGAVVSLAGDVVVGRGATASLQIRDPSMSARHLSVVHGRVRDLGSANGTRVNGSQLRTKRSVAGGDIIAAGASLIEVRSPAAVPQSPRTRRAGSLASLGGALSIAMVSLATGNWQFAVVALAVPAVMGARILLRSRAPLLDLAVDPSATGSSALVSHGPIAVTGPQAALRAVVLATGRPDATMPGWEPWMALMPHAAEQPVHWVTDGDVPSWAVTVVRATDKGLEVTADGTTREAPLALMRAGIAEASARRMAAMAARDDLPHRVLWGDLIPPRDGTVAARLGLSGAGTSHIDLEADGPHLLVAGTTGSGKSEALRTLVSSLAHDYPPSTVAFALIDFKGGAGLGDLARLPHVASLLTDLEPHLAKRALLALAAELDHRKRALAAAGGTSYLNWPQRTGEPERPPRLVIVVDEFQEITASYREFVPDLARLAAQGRSLGIHLVLSTQRPAGAVSAEIRANVSTTIALRTSSADESRDLIGTAAANDLPRDRPGRAIVMRGSQLELVQVAVPTTAASAPLHVVGDPPPPAPGLAEAAAQIHAEPAASPLWLPELPTHIPPAPASGLLTLGIADLPRERLRELSVWDPAAGPLVVVGPPRSGRTTALGAVCALAPGAGFTPLWLPTDPRLAVRTLALLDSVPQPLLAIDGADRGLSAAMTASPEAAELLAAAVARHAIAMVVPPSWASHRLVAGATTVVMTGLAAQECAAWNVPADLRSLAVTPGRAVVGDRSGWREVQLALAGTGSVTRLARPLPGVAHTHVPPHALGVGGDDAAVVELPRDQEVAVLGAPGAERDAVARRVEQATGRAPRVAESPFGLNPPPAVMVLVQPSHRSLREAMRDAPLGLLEPHHAPLRTVLVNGASAMAVQVARPQVGRLDLNAAAPPRTATAITTSP